MTGVQTCALPIYGNLSANDLDGYITKFEIAEEDVNQVDCKVSDEELGVTPAEDFQGSASCVIRAYDNEND